MSSVQVTRLSNGLRVVTDTMPQVETVSVGVWVDVGARYEAASENGLSHFLEHMAFKGTATRTARAIAEEIESVGGHLNAYTSREHTTYYARVLKDDLDLALDILGDILQHSTFEPDEFKREQDVILQEIGQVHDTPDDIVFDYLQEKAFPGQALGRSILGPAEQVAGYAPDHVRSYMQRHYRAESMAVVAAGNVHHERFVARVEDLFGGLKTPRGAGFDGGTYKGGEKREDRPLEQLHLTLGLPGFRYDDPDFYALQVFTTLLGGGMSSRLFQKVREERGLAYSVYSFASSHADSGLFGIYAGTGADQVAELLPVIAGELKSVAEKVSADELNRARAQLKAGLLMSLESTSARLEQVGRQMLIFDRVMPIHELTEKVDAVDEDAVIRACQRVMDGPLSLAAVGPTGGLPDFAEIQASFR